MFLQKLNFISSMETRRLLWLMALLFSLVLLVQHVELPYGYVLSSLLSFSKSRAAPAHAILAGGSSNITQNLETEFLNATKFGDGKNGTDKDELKSEMNMLSNGSPGIKNDTEADHPSEDFSRKNQSSTDRILARNRTLSLEKGRVDSSTAVPTPTTHEDIISQLTFPPPNLPSHALSPNYIGTKRRRHARSPNRRKKSKGRNPANIFFNNSKTGDLARNNLTDFVINSSSISTSDKIKWFKGSSGAVVQISEMNDMQREGLASLQTVKPQWPSQADKELLNAKLLIESANVENSLQIDANVYRNYSTFMRSYELMEQILKIYVYAEGDRPIFHHPELKGIYASEGWFMKQLEGSNHFVTKDPSKAHMFYFPFSSWVLRKTLYVKDSHSRKNMVAYLSNYLKSIATRYPFWNRTFGADHFLVACHDWAPAETRDVMKDCIRGLCNADVRIGFHFGKDVSIPEIYIHDTVNPLKDRGGKPPSRRHILAFFAGNKSHGYLRPILLDYWKDKDPDVKVFDKMRPAKGQMQYNQYMKSSKYCISAKGYEAFTPRVMEAILYDCVPVIISDNYVPPFFETLNWKSFAIFVLEKDIPNLKRILESIPKQQYLQMQKRVRQVQKHFLWHNTPVKHDVFHMILHSIWYTRVFQMTT